MTDKIRVGILGGLELSGNVRTLLENLRRLLDSQDQTFECDLLVAADIEPPEGYRLAKIRHGSAATARDRIRTLTQATIQYANSVQPDVLVQLTRFPTHGPAVAIAGRRTNTPAVTRLAGDNFREYRFAENTVETVRTFALKNVIALTAVHLPDAVVVLGPNGRKDIERRLRHGRVSQIPQPVNQSQFTPGDAGDLRDTLGIEDDERMLLTVGRVSRRKGAETIRHVAPTLDETTWVVLGDGPMRRCLEDVPGVEPVGRVPHEQIVEYYRAADLYVHPSLHEGLPNVLLEATACGTPCVARDVGECSTIAVESFSEDEELLSILDRTYGSVELDEQFAEETLAEQYASLLMEVSK